MIKSNRLKTVFIQTTKILILVLAGLITIQYFSTKIFRMPESRPFQGKYLYNPYDKHIYADSWQKANLHAHSISWGGLTNGHQTGQELVSAYHRHGYQVATVSDYHRINHSVYQTDNIAIPAYEHGMNLRKVHLMAIGAQQVSFFDAMLWQNNHIRQSIINELSKMAEVLAINHPGLRGGHKPENIKELTGYDCLEVLNGHRTYFAHWDSVLSAGRAVWILGNDDCHDLIRENFAIAWNLIHSDNREPQGILQSLKKGNTYAVRRKRKFNTADSLEAWALQNDGRMLRHVGTSDSTFWVKFNSPMDVRLIGQGGKKLAEFFAKDSVGYTFQPSDTYVRIEAENRELQIFLNPILRADAPGSVGNDLKARVNIGATFAWRLLWIGGYFLLMLMLYPALAKTLVFEREEPTIKPVYG
ncbi:MAG: hypothetical protein ACK4RF_09200 [Cyclobacteriaceae bacterium]